jgi:hypothetical protein
MIGGECHLRYGNQVVTRATQPGESFVFTPDAGDGAIKR